MLEPKATTAPTVALVGTKTVHGGADVVCLACDKAATAGDAIMEISTDAATVTLHVECWRELIRARARRVLDV